MVVICAISESRTISWRRFSTRKALKRLFSARLCSSCGVSALNSRAVPTKTKLSQPSTATQLTTATSRSGSLILLPSPRRPSREIANDFLARFRLRSGRRLTVIIGRRVPGSGLRGAAQREADREHQERRDLVDRHLVEHAVSHLELLDRVGQLDRNAQPVRKHLVEARDARAAARGEDPRDAAGGPAGALEKRGRPLDAYRELLAARLEQRVQRLVGVSALEHRVGLVGRQAALALQIFLEAAGADRDVPGEHRHAV